jgi:hypothetical protein
VSAEAAPRPGTTRAAVRLHAVAGGLPLGAVLAGIAVLAAAAVALLRLDALPFTFCAFKAATGWPCLTCGSTRAMARFFHGDLPGAFGMNPLAAVGVLSLLPWAAADLALLTRGRALRLELGPGAARAARVAVVAAAVINWAYLVAAGR